MKVLCTGISGSGRDSYLEKFEKLSSKQGKSIDIFHVGKLLFERAEQLDINLTKSNVLNSSPFTLKALRASVFEQIDRKIDESDSNLVVINSHTTFFWNRIFSRAFDWEYIRRLKPDLYCTIIDSAQAIKRRLFKSIQWSQQDLSEKEILIWQNIEQMDTEGLAENSGKPFYTIPQKQPASTLYKLIWHPELELVYISYPMTYLKDVEESEKVANFIAKLGKYFTVFDPGLIEIADPSKKVVGSHITHRDLYYLIKQSQKLIAYIPKPVFTAGVNSEIKEAYEANKDVWLVFPEEKGPFSSFYSQKIFKNPRKLFKWLKKSGFKKLQLD